MSFNCFSKKPFFSICISAYLFINVLAHTFLMWFFSCCPSTVIFVKVVIFVCLLETPFTSPPPSSDTLFIHYHLSIIAAYSSWSNNVIWTMFLLASLGNKLQVNKNALAHVQNQIILDSMKMPHYRSYQMYAVCLWKLFPFNMSHVYSDHWKKFQSV